MAWDPAFPRQRKFGKSNASETVTDFLNKCLVAKMVLEFYMPKSQKGFDSFRWTSSSSGASTFASSSGSDHTDSGMIAFKRALDLHEVSTFSLPHGEFAR